ncbi:MAG: toll/interleukin-1 receptor domain-containing protein [Opitutus sp.]|nr:toll/interleukin-1 receptor domain-containing protein [Opitutus sp.]MCS6246042.1 toll/interleukin-1 receptor domain-containing protein [Opitutus sp.]MCS6273925.1 toll/interleukin-1 receptor domain-containing protein [Opitutus sp.]MCS6276231.1 toll/interleukin-1 receptor domain-containing protein [Opitutus sp.]MCS6301325.1 toll/interleukin-1 receptor domain-containing protein [Opitutus sp.]
MTPSDAEVQRIWPVSRFRLFLSHLAVHKVAVSRLKQELAWRGVAAFVAHEDIEPSLEWRNEIELGLRSMHALATLLTPAFRESPWTDQEVGWALGRGLLVLPVRLGIDPYGFGGKYQGVSGTLEQPAVLASAIVDALLLNPQTHGEMRRSLVSSFEAATSFQMAKALRVSFGGISDFTDDEKERLRRACMENDQVKNAFGVAEAIFQTFGKPLDKTKAVTSESVPF